MVTVMNSGKQMQNTVGRSRFVNAPRTYSPPGRRHQSLCYQKHILNWARQCMLVMLVPEMLRLEDHSLFCAVWSCNNVLMIKRFLATFCLVGQPSHYTTTKPGKETVYSPFLSVTVMLMKCSITLYAMLILRSDSGTTGNLIFKWR